MRLTVVPCDFAEACAFVEATHRHHKPPTGHKFSIAVADESGAVRGVAMIGRPVSRHKDDGWTLEVNRVATDGAKNACSILYGAAWRAARSLGYSRLITYTLASEPGASLRGAGWKLIGEATTREGQGWNVKSRPRVDTHPLQRKLLWETGAAQALREKAEE
jgi:hypothetical protein